MARGPAEVAVRAACPGITLAVLAAPASQVAWHRGAKTCVGEISAARGEFRSEPAKPAARRVRKSLEVRRQLKPHSKATRRKVAKSVMLTKSHTPRQQECF